MGKNEDGGNKEKKDTCLVIEIGLDEIVWAQRGYTFPFRLGGFTQLPTKADVPLWPRTVCYRCNL